MKQPHPDLLKHFYARFPASQALKAVPVVPFDHDGYAELFDIDEVERLLGSTRFNALMQKVTTVYCCGHRTWASNHAEPHKRNAEVHCIAAADLEKFIAGGN